MTCKGYVRGLFVFQGKKKTEEALREAIKWVEDTEEDNTKLKEATEHVDAAEKETHLIKIKLRAEQEKYKELEKDKASIDLALKSLRRENDSRASKLEAYEQELAELKKDIPWIEEEKVTTFEIGLLLAKDHTDKTLVWDQIDWTTLWISEQIDIPVPTYFLQARKVKYLVCQYMRQKKDDATKKGKGKEWLQVQNSSWLI